MRISSWIARIEDAIIRRLRGMSPDEWAIDRLRARGARIGKDCLIHTRGFSTEPYLIDIGDHVAIASGAQFVTHDGAVWLFRDRHPRIQVMGRITVGNNTYIGLNCIILANTTIGSNCIIGAGSVVRGVIPDNSVVMGNPARIVMPTSLAETMVTCHKHRLDTLSLPAGERDRIIKEHFGLLQACARAEESPGDH